MRVEPNRNIRALSTSFVEAARRAGLDSQDGYNGRAYHGAWIAELAHAKGKRFSAYDAYLRPAMRRPNLEVVTGAHVTRIEIEDGRATGVAFRAGGTEHARSGRAVVLAAGAYLSPQLLMVSGIGPRDTLEGFEIPVLVDAPEVGENLQDHPVLPTVYRTSSRDTLLRAETPLQVLRYLVLGRGMLASNGVEGFAFTRSRSTSAAAPDLEILFLPFEFRKELLEPPREHAFSIGAAVVAPRSRGRVTLRSKDPGVAPMIDPGVLSDPGGVDARVLWEGVRLCRTIASTPPLGELNAGELRPGSSIESDDELRAYAAEELQTVYHPTSTCRMGSDERAVVDPRLRVRGIDALWVVDASVMPTVPRGHPNAVVAMIANRAAPWIEESVGRS